MCIEININLLNDYKQFLLNQFTSMGIEIDKDAELKVICIKYFNLMKRLIIQKPRKIHISKELSGKSLAKEIQQSFKTIKHFAKNGRNLNHYLSYKIFDLEFNDEIINDWDIHHLHLGNAPDKNKPFFIKRTSELLYLIVKEDAIYFIDILNHKSFADNYLMEIVCSNWPNLLEPYEMKNMLLGDSWTNKERKQLRRAGVMPLTQIGGRAYIPRGGGVSLSGLNSLIPLQVADELNRFKVMETHIKENISLFAAEIEKQKCLKAEKLDFRLHLENRDVYVKELNSDILFLIQRTPPN